MECVPENIHTPPTEGVFGFNLPPLSKLQFCFILSLISSDPPRGGYGYCLELHNLNLKIPTVMSVKKTVDKILKETDLLEFFKVFILILTTYSIFAFLIIIDQGF